MPRLRTVSLTVGVGLLGGLLLWLKAAPANTPLTPREQFLQNLQTFDTAFLTFRITKQGFQTGHTNVLRACSHGVIQWNGNGRVTFDGTTLWRDSGGELQNSPMPHPTIPSAVVGMIWQELRSGFPNITLENTTAEAHGGRDPSGSQTWTKMTLPGVGAVLLDVPVRFPTSISKIYLLDPETGETTDELSFVTTKWNVPLDLDFGDPHWAPMPDLLPTGAFAARWDDATHSNWRLPLHQLLKHHPNGAGLTPTHNHQRSERPFPRVRDHQHDQGLGMVGIDDPAEYWEIFDENRELDFPEPEETEGDDEDDHDDHDDGDHD